MDQVNDLYVITDGTNYMYRDKLGRWSGTSNITRADRYTYEKAQNVLVNAFNTKKRNILKLERYNQPVKAIKAKEEKALQVISKYGWLDTYYNQVSPLKSDIERRKDELVKNLSQADLELSDVYHFVKSNSPPAHVRTKVYKIEQDILLRREAIKEEIRCINVIYNVVCKEKLESNITGELTQDYKNRTSLYDDLIKLIHNNN